MLRLGSLLLLLLSPVAAQEIAVAVQLDEERTTGSVPLVLFPQARFELRAERPAGLDGVPALSPAARYAVVAFGERTLKLAFDAPEGAPVLGLLYTGSGQAAIGRARAGGRRGVLVDFADVAAGPIRIDVRLQFLGTELRSAGLQLARHRRGRVSIGGALREVLLVDADADGAYNGPADRWVALRVDRLRHAPNLKRAEALLLTEPQIPFEEDGRALMVDRVATDGSSLRLRLGPPSMRIEAVLERRYREVRAGYFESFKREREAFVRRHGLDTARARTFKPAAWLSMPLSEAKDLAQRRRRPLLVFYVTESNPWCYRYDYYTFRDKEVDALLRKFVLVRIDAEKDPERSHVESGGRGLPALMPLSAAGEPVTFRVRVRETDGRVSDLRENERMLVGWQRPAELTVNLERMLRAAGG